MEKANLKKNNSTLPINLDDEEQPEQASFFSAFSNFCKSLLGIAILDMPFIGNQVGFIYASILLILVLVFSIRSTLMLLEVVESITKGPITFGQTCRIILGPRVQQIADMFIAFNQMFVCIAYVIFFTKFFQSTFALLGMQLEQYIYLCISFVIIFPTIFVNNLHLFRSLSFIGLLFGLFTVFSTLCYETNTIIYGYTQINNIRLFNIVPTFSFIAIATTSMEGALTILPCRATMKKKDEIKYVLIFAEILYVSFVLLVMDFSIIVFGNQIEQMFVFNLPHEPFFYILILIYAGNILFTYPVQIFPTYIVLDHYFFSSGEFQEIKNFETQIDKENQSITTVKSLMVRFTLTIIIFCVAYFIPDLSSLLGILGALFGSSIQYILPIMMHWKVFTGQTLFRKAEYLILLLIASVAIVLGLYQSVKEMLKRYE